MKVVEAGLKVSGEIREYALSLLTSDEEDALLVAKGYGSFLWANYVGIFSDIEFENVIANRFSYLLNGRDCSRKFDILHLMTNALTSGGHTGVVLKLVTQSVGNGLAVLDDLPELVIKALPDKLLKYSRIRKQSGIETISAIIDVGCNFRAIILHINPDDIFSAIASLLLGRLGVKVYLYNHSDHSFSFGFGAAQIVFEISKYGWLKGKKRGITGKQSYVGVPVDLHHIVKNNRSGCLNKIFMAGSANKFIPIDECGVPRLLNRMFSDGIYSKSLSVTICGPTGSERFWNELDSDVRTKISFAGRLVYNEYLELLSKGDCYIDSFPLANGTGFAEAVMLGIPSFGLSLYAGYSCADILRSSSFDELVTTLARFNSSSTEFYSRVLDVREQLILEQSSSVCASRMRSAIFEDLQQPLSKSLASQSCDDSFHEGLWESDMKVVVPWSLFGGISTVHKLKLLHIVMGSYPFISLDFSQLLRKVVTRVTH